MADQRRYTQDQINAALASGEGVRGNESSWLSTMIKPYVPEAVGNYVHGQEDWYRKVGAGGINSFPQVLQFPEFISNVGGGAYDWATSKDPKATYGESVFKRSVGGDKGVKVLQDYMQQELAKYTQELPEHQRNDPAILAKLQAGIQGSEGYNRLREAQTGTLNQLSLTAQDFVRDKLGLNPTYSMSSTDNLADFIGGALVPTPSKVLKVIENAPTALKAAGRVAEWMMPGSSSAGNAAFNVAAPLAVDQTLRTVSGAPNYAAGTSNLPEELVAQDSQGKGDRLQPQLPQQVAPRHIPGVEDASASSPFSFVAPAAAAELNPAPAVVTQTSPDRDPEGGLGAGPWAKLAGVAGAATLVAAIVRGKIPVSALTRVVQDVDSPAAATRMDPKPTDHIMLEPALTLREKGKAAVRKTTPIGDIVRKHFAPNDPQLQSKVTKINREVNAASPLEVGNALKRTQTSGEVPLLNRNTIPTAQMRMMRDNDLDPKQQELFQKAAVYEDRLDSFKLETADLQQQVADLRNKAAGTTNLQLRQQLLNEAQVKSQQLTARASPQFAFDANLTMREVDAIRTAAAADPKVAGMLMGVRKVVDDFRQAGVHAEMYSQAAADAMRRERPNFIPVASNEYAKFGEGAKNIAARAKDALLKQVDEPTAGPQMFDTHRGPLRTNKMSEKVPVDQLKDVLDSLDTHIHEFHRQLRSNRAKQSFFETLGQSPEWGKMAQRAHAPVSVQDFERLSTRSRLGGIMQEPNVVSYNAGGQMHFMRLADSETARALRNNPSSTLAVADLLRRNLQKTYTGNMLSPAFAPVAAENELGVVRATLNTKYSKGWLDQTFKRVFPDTALSKFFDFAPDPSIRLQQVGSILEMVSNSAINRAGEAMGNHLMAQSPLIMQMGHQQATAAATGIIRAVGDARTRMQFFEHHGIIERRNLLDHNESIFKDWKAAHALVDKLPKPVTRVARAFFDGYLDFVDAVRNSVKYPIASQNLDNLVHKYNGFDKIPNDEMREYIHDMRYMSGDMTKAIGSPLLAKTASVAPFGTNIINSTLHLGEGVYDVKSGMYVGTRILTNMVAPKVAMIYLLTQWMRNDDGTNDFTDHYWDNIPTWQRMSVIPMLSPTFAIEMLTNGFRKPTVNDLIFMRQAPEAVPFAEATIAGLQAFGWFGQHAQDVSSPWHDIGHAIMSIANVNIPILDALEKMKNDVDQPTNLMGDSDGSRMLQGMFGAVFGSAVDVVGAGYKAATDSWHRGAPLVDAMTRGFQYAGETQKQKIPETPISPLFGGQRRHYTKTAVRDRNMDKFNKIKDVSATRTDEKGNITSDFQMPATDDYDAQTMARELHTTANAHTMKSLRNQRADLYNQLERLDYNRGNEKLPASEYTKRSEQLKMAINDIDRHEEEEFQRLDGRLAAMFGQLGVHDLDSAIEYIQSTMHP